MMKFFAALAALAAAALALLVFAIFWLPTAQDLLFRSVVKANFEAAAEAPFQEKDGLHLILCGTGSPVVDPERAASCALVIAGQRAILFDAGGGAARKMQTILGRAALPDAIFLTHFHSDHISDVGDVALMRAALGRQTPLAIYGPPGVERIARGFQEAYALDVSYRTAHHGAALMPPQSFVLQARPITAPRAAAPSAEESVIALEEDGITITAFRVDHDPAEPAYGYRVDYKGRSIIISGDTSKHPNLVRVGKDADIMLHDALNREMVEIIAQTAESGGAPRLARILRDTFDYHATPQEAAESANEAEAALLIYYHLVPPVQGLIAERIFLRGVPEIRAEGVMIGYDGLRVSLPVGSSEIEIGSLP